MSQIVDQILAASGGLNYDDDQRLFQSGDTDYRLNVIPTALGNQFVLTNMKGTTKKSHSFTHDSSYDGATYTSIGSCYDVERNAIYYFVYSDLTNHCIIRYNIDDDDFDKIQWDNPNLGFNTDYPIADAFMIDDWLYWNPGDTSPRAINVVWAYYNYVASPVTETVPTSDWDIGDICEFRSKVYRALSVVDTGTVPIGSADYEFVDWSYADNNFSLRHRSFFNTVRTPKEKIGIEFLDDASVKYNKVWGRVFQFTYSVYVPDLGVSISGPFTDVVADFDGETYDGDYTGDVTRNNRIRLRVPMDILEDDSDGRIDWLYERYDVLFREGDLGEWKLLRSLTHDEIYNSLLGAPDYFEVDFYNDGNYGVVDSAPVEKPYNFLPVTSKSQCALDGERSAYGGVTEGYGSTSTDVSFSAGIEEVTPVVDRSNTPVDSYTFVIDSSLTRYDDYGRPQDYTYETSTISTAGVSNGDKITVSIDGVRYEGVVIDQSTVSNYIDDLIAVINQSRYYAENQSTYIKIITESNAVEFLIDVYASATTLTDTYKLSTFKGGDHHPFCLFYYDHMGRMSNPIYTEDMRVYVPFLPEHYQQLESVADLGGAPNEVRMTCTAHGYSAGDVIEISDTTNYDGGYTITNVASVDTFDIESAYTAESFGDASAVTSVVSTNYRNNISWEIKHPPPTYAEQWGLGYAGRSTIGDFVQYNVYAVALGTGEYDSYVGLNINSLQDLTTNSGGNNDVAYPNSKIEPYTFEDGDRVRIITQENSGAADYDELIADNWTEYSRDYEIKGFDSSTGIVYIDVEIDRATWVSDYNDNTVFIELYKPANVIDDLIFYEIGPRYAIIEDSGNRFHVGPTQTQNDYDGTTPATGKIVAGDVYLITRAMSVTPGSFANNETLFLESSSWSDFYESEMWGKGKALPNIGIEQKTLNNVRYSNKLNKFTRSSSLGQFDGLDYKSLSYNYGDIVAMRQVGDVLSVLFANNVASVLVSATQMYNNDGTSQVLKSDSVLGSVNYSEEDYGCINPESVVVVDRSVYFFDLTRKCYVRKAPNGMFAISDYKMKKYFIDKSDEILTSGASNVKVRSAWDDDRGLLYVGFDDSETKTQCEYILFHEKSTRWVTFLSRVTLLDKFPLTAIDSSFSTSPNISMASVAGGTSYTTTFTFSGSGTYNDNATETLAAAVSLSKGQRVVQSYEVTTNGPGVDELSLFTLNVIGTGGVSSSALTFTALDAAADTDDTVLSSDGTISLSVTASGNESINGSLEIYLTWYVYDYDYVVPEIIGTPSKLISLVSEDVYLHNDSSTRGAFFDSEEECQVRIYGLSNPNVIKTFDSIALHTNLRWELEDVQIRDSLNYGDGMQSEIPKERFEAEEGVLRSDYLCNMKTNSSTANTVDLLNGDNLRGYTIYNDLTSDETIEHTLFKVDILSTLSKQ
jgi:hypothetical protein